MAEEPETPAPPQLRLLQLRDQITAAFDAMIDELDVFVEETITRTAAEHETAVRHAVEAATRQLEAAQQEAIARIQEEAAKHAAEQVAAVRVEIEAEAEARIAAAEEQGERVMNEKLREREEEAAQTLAEKLRASEEEAARTLDEKLRASEEEAARTLNEKLIALEEEAAASAGERLRESEEQAERTLAEKLQVAEQEARTAERESDLACIERILDGITHLDAATTLSQVLEVLCNEAAAAGAGRVALLVSRDGSLRGFSAHGFDIPDPTSLDVRPDGDSVVAAAARTHRIATTRDDDSPAAPSFAELPEDRVGIAVPLTVAGRTVAVMYADDVGEEPPIVPSAWPEVMELLARHAAKCLELHTVTRAYGLHAHKSSPASKPGPGQAKTSATQADESLSEEDESAQRYARLLISEIKLYHEDAVNAGRRDQNLLKRLGPEIDRARRLYDQRVPSEVRSRADYFSQELIRTLANGDPRLLGQAT